MNGGGRVAAAKADPLEGDRAVCEEADQCRSVDSDDAWGGLTMSEKVRAIFCTTRKYNFLRSPDGTCYFFVCSPEFMVLHVL